MKIRQGAFLSALVTTVSASCAGIDEGDHATARQAVTEALTERAQLAESGLYLVEQEELNASSAATMATALDIPANVIVSNQLTSPHAEAAMDVPNLGILRPRQGTSLVVMSTGRNIATVSPEPGTDFAPGGTGGDVVTWRMQLRVPQGASRMSFDFNFLSAESPDFVGSSFNDTFVARVTDALGTRAVANASVNSSVFHEASDSRAGGTGYVLYVDDPSGVDSLFGSAAYPPGLVLHTDAGLTDFQTVNVAVTPGATMTLEFDIRDLGDGILDSAVLLDNLTFSAVEVLDPNPDLLTELGTVRSGNGDLADLAVMGKPVGAVAADGTTQVLLRTNVSGPGQVTFALVAANAGDGGLAALGANNWQNTVTVPAVQAPSGKFYGLALYRSPADFNRGATQAAQTRGLRFSVAYAPAAGAGFQMEHALNVVRPPVVVVHDVWSSCTTWMNAKLYNDVAEEYPFEVTCADYETSNAKSFQTNRQVVPDTIAEAIIEMRDHGVAVSQADVIGHGMGGLLARRYVDTSSYARSDNFLEGDIHRLIAMNTPHLGARMADEIVTFRQEAQKTPTVWNGIKTALKNAKIGIDDAIGEVAIDELRTTSNIITDLNDTRVPSHVLVSTGGLDIVRDDAYNMLGTSGVKQLYLNMEGTHPKTKGKPKPTRDTLIFGGRSMIFCGDQHDFFATAWDQAGGVAVAPGSLFTLNKDNVKSEHFKVHTDTLHSDRLAALLQSPIGGGLFVPTLPAPRTVAKVNSCAPPPAAASDEGPIGSLATGSLAIVSPSPGTVVTPGSNVNVAVEGRDGFQPDLVMIIGEGQVFLLEAGPFVAAFPIPASAIGGMSLMALAFDDEGDIAFSQEVRLNVNVPATLQSLTVLNGDAVLSRPGITRQLTVLGSYSDGIRRNISAGQLGTRYSSSNPDIAQVSNDGLVTAVSPGVITVVVRNGVAITSINVKVEEGSLLPEAVCRNVTVAANASCQAQASVDGGSSDPDGLPQPLVLAQSPAGPYGLGSHAVTLSVSDGASSDSCQATVTVVDNAPPALAGCDDITVEATPGLGGAYVNYTVTGSDNCGGSVPVACNVASGSFFAMGETVPVTCTAADSAGNGATCTFPVEVQEPTTCDASYPQSQDYWRTQCNYRAPDGTPPDPTLTSGVLQRLLDEVQPGVQAVCGPAEAACDSLNPDPYWDACEQACQHYAGLLLNVASGRAPSSCCTVQGTSADTAAYVAELITAGQCHEAVAIASDFNIGCLFCGAGH